MHIKGASVQNVVVYHKLPPSPFLPSTKTHEANNARQRCYRSHVSITIILPIICLAAKSERSPADHQCTVQPQWSLVDHCVSRVSSTRSRALVP